MNIYEGFEMKKSILTSLLVSLLCLGLIACGGGGGGSSDASSIGVSDDTLLISGDDTSAIGNELVLSEFSYSQGTGSADQLLIATSAGALTLILGEENNVSESILLNNVVINIFTIDENVAVSMLVTRDGNEYEYVFDLDSTPIDFNADNRRVDFNGAELRAADSGSLSNGTLSLTGALTWNESDEDLGPLNGLPSDDSENGDYPSEFTLSISGEDVDDGLIDNHLTILAGNLSGGFSDGEPEDALTHFFYYDDEQEDSGASNYSLVFFTGSGLTEIAIDEPRISLTLELDGAAYDYRCATGDDWDTTNIIDCSGITAVQVGNIITVTFDDTTLQPGNFSDATAPVVINGTLVKDTFYQ